MHGSNRGMTRDLKETMKGIALTCLFLLLIAIVPICAKAPVVNFVANLLAHAFRVFFD